MILRKKSLGSGGRAMTFSRDTPCPCQDLTLKTQLEAVNGKKMPALQVFAHALHFFKEHALQVPAAPPLPTGTAPLSPS